MADAAMWSKFCDDARAKGQSFEDFGKEVFNAALDVASTLVESAAPQTQPAIVQWSSRAAEAIRKMKNAG